MRKINRKRRVKAPWLLIAVLGMLLAFSGITAARYVNQAKKENLMSAENFYFTSDLLREESADGSKTAVYYIDPLTGSFTVELYNYADDMRIMSKNINYTVTVENGTAADPALGTLSVSGNSAVKANAKITITPTPNSSAGNAGAGNTSGTSNTSDVTVTVTSTSPYKKTLKAVFKRELGNQFQLVDEAGNRAAVLTMTCPGSSQAIKIILPEGVIPDGTDSRVTYENSTCTFTSPGEGIYTIILFKKDANKVLTGNEGDFFANRITIGYQ